VHTRDRTCRFPNCGQRVGWADADHVVAHACGGPTDCANLCCLCRSHHRLKTFAPGWRFTMSDDGVLTVTTPSGVSRTTRPPGMRLPPDDGAQPASADPDPTRPDDDGADDGKGRSGARPLGIRELIERSRVGPDAPPLDRPGDPPPF
jgi:hypothetical protein